MPIKAKQILNSSVALPCASARAESGKRVQVNGRSPHADCNATLAGYSPWTDTNSNTDVQGPGRSQGRRRDEKRARRSYTLIRAGALGHETVFFTLTKGRDVELELRDHWHLLLTRAKRRWPDCEAVTVYEYSPQRGAHLHVVMKNAPGVTSAWLQHVLDVCGSKVNVGGFRLVYDTEGLARYLTKQMRDRVIVDGWPRYFRPLTMTRNWCPGWLPRAEWAALSREGRRRAARRIMGRERPVKPEEACA
jgi:hypothetical protein